MSSPNIPCLTGAQVTFNLYAGMPYSNKNYWVWFNVTGLYPGFNVSGQHVPLNMDPLFNLCLQYPTFPGTTGFMGKFMLGGSAIAHIQMPADYSAALVGVPFNFLYVVTGPGPSLPIEFVSNPVNLKYSP